MSRHEYEIIMIYMINGYNAAKTHYTYFKDKAQHFLKRLKFLMMENKQKKILYFLACYCLVLQVSC